MGKTEAGKRSVPTPVPNNWRGNGGLGWDANGWGRGKGRFVVVWMVDGEPFGPPITDWRRHVGREERGRRAAVGNICPPGWRGEGAFCHAICGEGEFTKAHVFG